MVFKEKEKKKPCPVRPHFRNHKFERFAYGCDDITKILQNKIWMHSLSEKDKLIFYHFDT